MSIGSLINKEIRTTAQLAAAIALLSALPKSVATRLSCSFIHTNALLPERQKTAKFSRMLEFYFNFIIDEIADMLDGEKKNVIRVLLILL